MSTDESDNNRPVRLVLQRFRRATLLLNETETVTCGSPDFEPSHLTDPSRSSGGGGILCYVSFTASATADSVRQAARTVVNVPVMTEGAWGDGSDTVSALDMASRRRGDGGGAARDGTGGVAVMVVPQANLICKIKSQGRSIQYHGQIDKDKGRELYTQFVDSIKALALERQCTDRGEPPPPWTTELLHGPQKKTVPPGVEPSRMFRTSEYSAWDDATGLPTALASGEPVSKSAAKKLRKQRDAHVKKHEKYLAAAGGAAVDAEAPPVVVAGVDWSVLDDGFVRVVAGTFGKRQGLEVSSDMGPFCHVVA